MEEHFSIFRLENGIRLVHLQVNSYVGHCGLLINTGSRDEKTGETGIAHFLEHVLFKGTTKRSAFRIISSIDELGGELNAYTTKENTFVYATFPGNYLGRALDVITDITFRSTFPKKEIEKERLVVLDEILSYKDDPSEEISDQFDEMLFPGHPLGNNILGTEKTVANFDIEHIRSFIGRTYNTDQMVLGYVGPMNAEKFRKIAGKALEWVTPQTRNWSRKAPKPYTPAHITEKRDLHSAHAMIGNRAYPVNSEKRVPFFMLNNILGGPGLNSRLNLNIREKYGYTYYLESAYSPFDDTGMWSLYLATDKKNLQKSLDLVYKELRKLREHPLSESQLQKAKIQVKGQMALANESHHNILHGMVRSLQVLDTVESIPELHRQIDEVTSEGLMEAAQDIFDEKKLGSLVYVPLK